MKLPCAEISKDFKTNLDESKSLNFSLGDPAVIIDILRNRMYETKIQSLVQEYLCNARDANREVGQTRSIEVTFPSKQDMTFSVRDWGLGITPDRMEQVFVIYGASTKRETNAMTGGWGLGSKSAWSYTPSFTIVTYIDGVQRTYVAHIAATKSGRVDLLSEVDTVEPNGTKISIAINSSDQSDFRNAIIRATLFWNNEEYPVFRNADTYANQLLTDARKQGVIRFMGSNLSGASVGQFVYTRGYTIIAIDGIPYPLPNSFTSTALEELRKEAPHNTMNVFIPNGLVQVSASREKIDDSDVSKSALKQIFIAALADFRRNKELWEDSISDSATLLAAVDKSAGFSLTSTKTIDLVSLKQGHPSLATSRVVDDLGERLFHVKRVTSDTSKIDTFRVNATNRYYLTRGSALTVSDIKDWISSQPNISNIHVITILGHREIKETYTLKDGTTRINSTYKRNKELVADLVPLVERLGFIDLEPLIIKPGSPKRETIKRSGKIYKTILGRYNNGNLEELVAISSLEEKPKKPWIYFVGNKHDYNYTEFKNHLASFVELGCVGSGFRVIESNKKLVVDDKRFIEYSQFLKDWKIEDKHILSFVANNSVNTYQSTRVDSSIMGNLLHLKDKNSPLIKLAKKLSDLNSHAICYDLRCKIQNDDRFKAALEGIKELNDFFYDNVPFLKININDKKHIQEYLEWALDRCISNGVQFVLSDSLTSLI